MEQLITVAVYWLLTLLSLWFVFIGFLRLWALKNRLKRREGINPDTGAFLPGEMQESDTDRREAFNEEVAHLRGRFEKRRGMQ